MLVDLDDLKISRRQHCTLCEHIEERTRGKAGKGEREKEQEANLLLSERAPSGFRLRSAGLGGTSLVLCGRGAVGRGFGEGGFAVSKKFNVSKRKRKERRSKMRRGE